MEIPTKLCEPQGLLSVIPLVRKMVLSWIFICLWYSKLLMTHSFIKPSPVTNSRTFSSYELYPTSITAPAQSLSGTISINSIPFFHGPTYIPYVCICTKITNPQTLLPYSYLNKRLPEIYIFLIYSGAEYMILLFHQELPLHMFRII